MVNGIITVLKQRVEEGEWFYSEVRGIPLGISLPAMKSTPVTTIASHLTIESGCLKQALQRAERALVLIPSRSKTGQIHRWKGKLKHHLELQ